MQQDLRLNYVIPAPVHTVCGAYKCQCVVKQDDLDIVRYNGKIFHRHCFEAWFPRHKRGLTMQERRRLNERLD